jgi:hypothetical protein
MAELDSDVRTLRDLAKRYQDICSQPVQEMRRQQWRRLNSRESFRPLIYVRHFAWAELPEAQCTCTNEFLRQFEDFFRYHMYWDSLNDDSVFEPWVTVPAVYTCTGWGMSIARTYSGESGGAFKTDYPIKTIQDIEKLRMPWHGIDEVGTRKRLELLGNAIGDLIEIEVDRAPAYRMAPHIWAGDIASELGDLRGIENMMLDMFDRPKWLRRFVAFLRDGIQSTHEQAERAGDWSMANHMNQAMPYAMELEDPRPHSYGVTREQLWGYMAAQEMTLVSPQMHNDFLLEYQLPILRKFGLVAYGCCENLTNKIGILRRIPNLRRIGVSPFADVARCVENIRTDYVISYRPSPTDMISFGLDEDRIRSILRRDFGLLKGTHFDLTLKDVETVQHDSNRPRRWVTIAREEIERAFCNS